jgi:formylglycine-generating enzyme
LKVLFDRRTSIGLVVAIGWLATTCKAPVERAEDVPEVEIRASVTQLLARYSPGAPMRASQPRSKRAACPDGMVLVEGEYCPEPEHVCLRYLDPPGKFRRCGEYERPARCTSKRKRSLRFCIDRDEYVGPNDSRPRNHVTFEQAALACEELGRRLCSESEWNFACEGESMQPYPYGWKRDASACNADHLNIANEFGGLRDLRVPPGTYTRCTSPFGVRDLTGNVEEFVRRDDRPDRPAMKGAHWLPGRNHCRAAQRVHGPRYGGVETGFRCCADVHGN